MTDTLRHALALDNIGDAIDLFEAEPDRESMYPFIGMCGTEHHDVVCTTCVTGEPSADVSAVVAAFSFAIKPTHIVAVMSSWIKIATTSDQAAIDAANLMDHKMAEKARDTDPTIHLGLMALVWDCLTDETTAMGVVRMLNADGSHEWVRGNTVVTPDVAEMIADVQTAYKYRPDHQPELYEQPHTVTHIMAQTISDPHSPGDSNVVLIRQGFLIEAAQTLPPPAQEQKPPWAE